MRATPKSIESKFVQSVAFVQCQPYCGLAAHSVCCELAAHIGQRKAAISTSQARSSREKSMILEREIQMHPVHEEALKKNI
jgi:hypothetical protein